MNIKQRKQADFLIFDLSGHFDTTTAPGVEVEINKIIDDQVNKIIINLSDVEYISSSGLRVLLATLKQLKKEDGVLRIFGLNETVQEIFDISGFSVIFDLFKGETEALKG
ncbi:MAG: STAS domain-containing protein [Candidatus Neomarinimicrobiota bacterium]